MSDQTMEASADFRPAKKRRFFENPSPLSEHALAVPAGGSPPTVLDAPLPQLDTTPEAALAETAKPGETILSSYELPAGSTAPTFDRSLFESIIGESIPSSTLDRLQAIAGADLEKGRSNAART